MAENEQDREKKQPDQETPLENTEPLKKEEQNFQEKKSEEAKPEETTAEESKPQEKKPEEKKPEEKKPEEKKPAEQPAGDETAESEMPPVKQPPPSQDSKDEEAATPSGDSEEKPAASPEENKQEAAPEITETFQESIKGVPLPYALDYVRHFTFGKYFFFITQTKELQAVSPQSLAKDAPVVVEEDTSQPEAPSQVFFIRSNKESMIKRSEDFLAERNIETIYLQDKNHAGRPWDEVIQEYPRCKFAIVLMSGDDFVYDKENGKPADAMLKAKQDVIFLLGFLMAKLGKTNVFILFHEQKSFLLPVALHQGIFTPYKKDEKWKDLLLSRMKAAGYFCENMDNKPIRHEEEAPPKEELP